MQISPIATTCGWKDVCDWLATTQDPDRGGHWFTESQSHMGKEN